MSNPGFPAQPDGLRNNVPPPRTYDPSTGLAAYDPVMGQDRRFHAHDQPRLVMNDKEKAFWQALVKSNGYDKGGEAGSYGRPYTMFANSANPLYSLPVGKWFVDYDGVRKQIIDDPRDPGNGHIMAVPEAHPATAQPPADATAAQPKVSGLEDAARSFGGGLWRGGTALVGLPGDIDNLEGKLTQGVVKHTLGPLQEFADDHGVQLYNDVVPFVGQTAWEKANGTPPPTIGIDRFVGADGQTHASVHNAFARSPMDADIDFARLNGHATTDTAQNWVENHVGHIYQPQTEVGRLTNLVGENLPAAVLPGSWGLRTARVLGPAFGGYLGGRLTQGTSLEPYGQLGGSLLGGFAGDVATGLPYGQLARHFTNVSDDQIQQIAALRDSSAALGASMSLPEAADYITGSRTDLTPWQLKSENYPATAGGWRSFYADRPKALADAVNNHIESIGPSGVPPSEIMQRARAAARRALTPPLSAPATPGPQIDPDLMAGAIDQLQQGIANEPSEAAASSLQRLQSQLIAQPAIPAALPSRIPGRKPGIFHIAPGAPAQPAVPLTDTNVLGPRLQAWRRYFNGLPMDDPSVVSLGQHLDNLEALLRSSGAAEIPHDIQSPGALALKRMGDAQDISQATEPLFPDQPPPGTGDETTAAINALNAHDSVLSALLARQHFGALANDAFRSTGAGPDQFAGFNFRQSLFSHPEGARNVGAALTAIDPSGALGARTNDLSDILGATGMRKPPAEPGTFSDFDRKTLGLGSLDPKRLSALLTPEGVKSALGDAWKESIFEHNAQTLADLMRDPDTAGVIQRLRARGPLSGEALIQGAMPVISQRDDLTNGQ